MSAADVEKPRLELFGVGTLEPKALSGTSRASSRAQNYLEQDFSSWHARRLKKEKCIT